MRLLRFYFGYLLLPNLLFNIAMLFVYMGRATINVDYLLLGAVAAFLPRIVIVSLFILLMVIDIVSSFSPAYFMGLATMLASIKYAFSWNVWTSLPITVAILGVFTAIAILAVRISPPRRKFAFSNVLAAVIMLIVVYAFDIGNNTSLWQITDRSYISTNIACSSGFKVIRAAKTNIMRPSRGLHSDQLQKRRSSAENLITSLAAGDKSVINETENVLFVMVESFGKLKDDRLNQLLIEPLLRPDIQKRYVVEVRDIISDGATTTAEFRDLCGVKLESSLIDNYSIPKCLPRYLKELGFDTLALHGFSRTVFDRYKWYPEIGFTRTIFIEDAKKLPGVSLCGSILKGISDVDMANIIHKELLDEKKKEGKFIFWLTLNAHMPLDDRCAAGSKFDCNNSNIAKDSKGFCTWMKIIYLTISSIAEIAADPQLPSTRIYVVGDHNPAFLRSNLRDLYVNQKAPLIELVPRMQ